ncbi:MAG: outer membrane beta-barrel protein [Bacteroidetes bacterium]|nr:outer membrane beta-barrel protein [Bacteroidota bacterium]
MKKQIALIAACLSVITAFSQNDGNQNKLRLGILATSSYGWVSTDTKNISGGGLKAGIGFGIYGDFYFAKNYALCIEVLHSTQGYKINADSLLSFNSGSGSYKKTGNVNIDYKIRSFQIPITLKLRTNEIGYWRYYGQVGIAPAFAYRGITANYKPAAFENADDNSDRMVNSQDNDFVDVNTISENNRKYFLQEDNILGIRVPILIGGGAEWNLSGNTAILMGVRYEYGLINMMRAQNTIARRNVLNLVAGVRF